MSEHLVERIAALLAAGETVVVATVVAASGSTPRGIGARLVLRAGGTFEGTVGGGLLEARVLEGARRLLAEGGRPRLLELPLDAEPGHEDEMICGGRAEVLIERLAP